MSMDVKKIFEILKIPETKDEKQIQRAYRALLVHVNPEDDPEGFKRLRAAYELAMEHARTSDAQKGRIQTTGWIQDSPVGEFMGRAMDIYDTFPRRIDGEEWKALVSDPVFESLDDGETAKWALFSYLSEHFRLPCGIWRVLDRAFHIGKNQQEFREQLPGPFVDYILNKIQQDERTEISYDRFRGAPRADYDGFMRALFDLLNRWDGEEQDREWIREIGQRLDALGSFKIVHPWYDLERARYLDITGETEEALSLLRRLLGENPEDERIQLCAAGILADRGYGREAHEIFEKYLSGKSTAQGAYEALYRLACIEDDWENWEQARSYLLDAKRLGNTDRLQELLARSSRKLVEKYTSMARTLTQEEVIRLGWCFFDGKLAQEGAAFFAGHPEYQMDTAEFHKIMAYLYRELGDSRAVLKEIDCWRSHLERELRSAADGDGQEKEDERLWELALGYHMEGGVLRRLFNELWTTEGDSPRARILYDDSRRAHDRAVELAPEDTEFRLHRVLLFDNGRKYQEMADDCREILKRDGRHFWAWFYLQGACEGLGRAQEVVDIFYRAKEIYGGNPTIYLRAVKALTAYEKYGQALDILEQAGEARVDGYHPLIMEKIDVLNHLVEDEESWQRAEAYGEEAVRRLTEEKAADWLLAESCMRMACLYERNQEKDKEKRLEKAIQYAERSLKLYETERARYFVGRFYIKYRKDAKTALAHLTVCEERGMSHDWLYFYIAQCHEQFKDWNKAIEYYQKAIEKNPEFPEGYWRIGWIYRGKLNRTEQPEYAKLALHYISLHEEKIRKTNETYRWRAYVYLRMKEYDKALEQIDQGVQAEGDSGMWYLRGQILREMRRYDEAIESFENSIRAEDRFSADDEESYNKIFQCFLRQGRLKECAAYFHQVLKLDLEQEVRDTCLEKLSDLEGIAGNRDGALMWQEKRYGSLDFSRRVCDDWEKEASRIEDVLEVWQKYLLHSDEELKQRLSAAALLAEEAYADQESDPGERASMCHNVGDGFYYAGDYRRALDFLEKALKLADRAEKYGSPRALYLSLMQTCFFLGESEKAEEYGNRYRERLERTYKECDDLELPLEEMMTRPRRGAKRELYRLFCWAFYTGRQEQARDYAGQMEQADMCYWCDEDGCTEFWEIKGYLAYMDGKYEEALEDFRNAGRFCWLGLNKDAAMMIRRLTEELPGEEK